MLNRRILGRPRGIMPGVSAVLVNLVRYHRESLQNLLLEHICLDTSRRDRIYGNQLWPTICCKTASKPFYCGFRSGIQGVVLHAT